MSKLSEAGTRSSATDVGNAGNGGEEKEESVEDEKAKEEKSSAEAGEKRLQTEDERKEILRFTMLFNKYNGVLDVKRSSRSDENKYAMFFNKEATIRQKLEEPSATGKVSESKKAVNCERDVRSSPPSRSGRSRSKFCSQNVVVAEPQISDPGMMFASSLTSSPPDVFEWKTLSVTDNLKRFLNKRNPKADCDPLTQLNVHPTAQAELRIHNSLTSLSKDNQLGLKVLKSKIPSLTALDTSLIQQKSGLTRFSYWDHWDDLTLMQSDADKRLNLQVSRSSNDNNRRSAPKLKKEDAASVSDSKLLYTDLESKKHIKKCDKKSRGDSSKKERESGSRKQVQWKTEVDVIYFSTHLAANGDRTGEVLGRVMEPLREEWEQQRKESALKLSGKLLSKLRSEPVRQYSQASRRRLLAGDVGANPEQLLQSALLKLTLFPCESLGDEKWEELMNLS